MANIIQIKIPDQLKQKFESDKYLLPEHRNIEENISRIENYLKEDNIVALIKLIDSIYIKVDFASHEYNEIQKKGFYQEFSSWLDFALTQLMHEINIDINHILKRTDMYAALCHASEQLAINNTDNIEKLVSNTMSMVIEEKENIDDNPQLREMCSLFINIGKRKIIPEEFADISYENFLSQKNINSESSNKIHQ